MREPVAMFADDGDDGGRVDRFGDSLPLRRGRHRSGMEEANRLEDKQARKNDSQRPARRSIEICVVLFHKNDSCRLTGAWSNRKTRVMGDCRDLLRESNSLMRGNGCLAAVRHAADSRGMSRLLLKSG